MIEGTKSERVIVTGKGEPFEATTTHLLYADILDRTGKIVAKGDFLGVGVRMDTGHELYARPDQLQPL